MQTAALFDIQSIPEPFKALFNTTNPWDILTNLDAFWAHLKDHRAGSVHPTAVLEGDIYLEEGASIGPHAYVKGPAYIASGAEVGHAAYLRGQVVLAQNTKVGHSSEVKRSILLPDAKAPHFNYVGDSVVGQRVNLGAGVKIANFKAFANTVNVNGSAIGVKKFGAAIGDDVSVGCNAVLVPGTLIGPRSIVYNNVMVRGSVPADTILKLRQTLESALRH